MSLYIFNTLNFNHFLRSHASVCMHKQLPKKQEEKFPHCFHNQECSDDVGQRSGYCVYNRPHTGVWRPIGQGVINIFLNEVLGKAGRMYLMCKPSQTEVPNCHRPVLITISGKNTHHAHHARHGYLLYLPSQDMTRHDIWHGM